MTPKRMIFALVSACAALLLTGCFLTAGKFDSELTLTRDGQFSYRYTGEIQMLALTELASMGQVNEEFVAETCWDDATFEERDCTAEELAEQKKVWAEGAAERELKSKKDVETAKAVLGGIDPSSPEAGKQIAERLLRQRGWNRVDYKGNGLFDVEFAIQGALTHDFVFPLIERFPLANGFVTVVLRDDGQVRVDAPGFVLQDQSNPMRAMMSGMAGMAAMDKGQGDETKDARLILPNGRFSIITDGEILANNTDEGPGSHPKGRALTWQIDGQAPQPPMALIDLSKR